MRFLRIALIVVAVLAVIGFGVWGALALWYRPPFLTFQTGLCAFLTVMMLAALTGPIWRPRRSFALIAIAVAALLTYWSTLSPSNARDWAPDVARAVHGEVAGDNLTLTDIRDFDWRSESDFTPRWEARTYALSTLVSVDLIADYWNGEAIAHTLVSFGFSDGRFLTWSIELRKTRGQSWSALGGFFKQSELVILAGDERDLIHFRTNIRGEDLRLYRLNADHGLARQALLAYVAEANDLAERPRWYNTATTNCTTAAFQIARIVHPGFPLDWRILLSGYFPDYAYDNHPLDESVPFAELRERAKISARAKAADAAPSAEFSQAIRRGIPGVAQ